MGRQLLKSDMEEILERFAQILTNAGYVEGAGDDGDKPSGSTKPHLRKQESDDARDVEQRVHKLGKKSVCGTDERGYPTPSDQAPTEIVLDASEGFIPLWDYGVTLRWTFDEVALSAFENPTSVKRDVRRLLSEAILAWGDSAPVRFKEQRESYDFRVVVHNVDRCSPYGCTLARAFFPDAGRHDLEIYPRMFEQSEKEQVDTLTHELGHIFGLRHFFASVRESQWPSVVFGTHRPFSIMNYGAQSELTSDDKHDLKRLYEAVWSGTLPNINGTPIRLFRPYHEAGTLVKPNFFNAAALSNN